MNVLLITDLDNTLYNWVDYFGRSFRGMTHALCKRMGIEESEFIGGAKEVFKRVGTIEYAFIVQQLPFISKYSEEDIQKYIDFSKKIFQIVKTKNLVLYDGVLDTLKYLYSSGVSIVGVTNAPIQFGESRLIDLHIDKYFYGILGWEGTEIPEEKYTLQLRKNISAGSFRSPHIKKRWKESKENIKPNPIGYLKVLSRLMVSHKNTYILGDSLERDIKPAIEIGAHSIWAKYGTTYEKKNLDTLLSVTHWDENTVNREYSKTTINPEYTIESFGELRNIISGPQLNLFS